MKHSTQLVTKGAMPYPLSLCRRRQWLTESKALDKSRWIRSTALPSSSHFVIRSSASRSLVRVDRRGRKPCCGDVNNENWDKWASIFSLRIASSTLKTTGVRLMGLNRFGSAVRGRFATGVTMAWRQSSGIWKVWRERLKMQESIILYIIFLYYIIIILYLLSNGRNGHEGQ